MEYVFTYSHPSYAASVLIKQAVAPLEHDLRRRIFDLIDTLAIRFQRLNINDDTCYLEIQFDLHTDLYWCRPAPHDPGQFQGRQVHEKSLHLNLDLSVHVSYDTF